MKQFVKTAREIVWFVLCTWAVVIGVYIATAVLLAPLGLFMWWVWK